MTMDAENALILLYDLCRLCLDEPGVINIFGPDDWSQDILAYTGIKVTTSDKLPQTICVCCRDIINCVKILKDISSTNDKRLQLIRGSDNQVFATRSHSHLVIISSCTACVDQTETTEAEEVPSSSVNESLKNRIVYESEDEKTKATEKKRSKKRKSSKSDGSGSSDLKVIAVRKDLFSSSTSTTSSSSAKTNDQSPTSTTNNGPGKTVTAGGKLVKILGDLKFQCETCNKTYATSKKLYLHQLAHNKKFYCPLDACSKKFATKGDLQKHIRSHTGEKPYKCNLCDQSFTQNVTLKSHKERIHNEPLSQG